MQQDKLTSMRRFVVYYKDTGHVYIEGVALDGCALVRFRDSDLPNIAYFEESGGYTGLGNLLEFIARLPEGPDLTHRVLDDGPQDYNPLLCQFVDKETEQTDED